jgi:hypothetical protein
MGTLPNQMMLALEVPAIKGEGGSATVAIGRAPMATPGSFLRTVLKLFLVFA